jgi:hypothetical protein
MDGRRLGEHWRVDLETGEVQMEPLLPEQSDGEHEAVPD